MKSISLPITDYVTWSGGRSGTHMYPAIWDRPDRDDFTAEIAAIQDCFPFDSTPGTRESFRIEKQGNINLSRFELARPWDENVLTAMKAKLKMLIEGGAFALDTQGLLRFSAEAVNRLFDEKPTTPVLATFAELGIKCAGDTLRKAFFVPQGTSLVEQNGGVLFSFGNKLFDSPQGITFITNHLVKSVPAKNFVLGGNLLAPPTMARLAIVETATPLPV